VLSRAGQSATTAEICERFDIARSTLLDRRDVLAAGGVVFLAAGANSRYCG